MKLLTALGVILGVFFLPATASASWDFRHDQRTCWLGDYGWKIVTNEDECGWPKDVVEQAITYGYPRFVNIGSHRYKRVRFRPWVRGSTLPLKATYRSSPPHWRGAPAIWFRITAYKVA